MRETSFIQQNKEKWERFEKILGQENKDPDELSEVFVQLTDDLAYSRTFYPNRSVRYYLNRVAQRIFNNVYKKKRFSWANVVEFWQEDLPQILYHSRKELFVSFFVFALAMLIGVVSSANDPAFYNVILGPEYVQMTKENIQRGDPMAVYKGMNHMDMFMGITINNVLVALRTFLFGVLFAIGTLGILIYNGVMVGSFQYFFYEQGLFQESFLTIWMHGALEISAIIIAGAAGLVCGKGLAFPGTHSRLQAFQISAMRGLKIFLGTTPLFLVAGFIEGFITRYTEAPDILRLLMILVCFAFVLVYFVWYPSAKARKGFKQPLQDAKLPASLEQPLDFNRIKSNGQLVTGAFLFYRKIFRRLFVISILLGFVYTLITYLVLPELSILAFDFDVNFFGSLMQYWEYGYGKKILFPLNVLLFTIPVAYTYYHLYAESRRDEPKEPIQTKGRMAWIRQNKTYLWQPLVMCLFVFLTTILLPGFLSFAIILPFLMMCLYINLQEQQGFLDGLSRAMSILSSHFTSFLGLWCLFLLITALFLFFVDSPIVYFYLNVFDWNLDLDLDNNKKLLFAFLTFIFMTSLALVLPILLIGIGLYYHNIIEINEAKWLTSELKDLGQKRDKTRRLLKLKTIVWLLLLSLMAGQPLAAQNNTDYLEEAIELHQMDEERWEELTSKLDYTPPTLDEETRKKLELERMLGGGSSMHTKEKELKENGRKKRVWNGDFFKTPTTGGIGEMIGGLLKLLVILSITIVLGFVIYKLMRHLLFERNKKIEEEILINELELAEEDIHQSDLDKLLQRVLAQGNYKLAIRIHYLKVLRFLSERNWIRWRKKKTNMEYLMEMQQQPQYPHFQELTLIFERIWYGDVEINQEKYQELVGKFTSFSR